MAVEIKKLSVPWQISIYSVYAESKIVRSRYFETWPIIQYNTLSTIHICWFWAILLTTFYFLLNLIIIQSTIHSSVESAAFKCSYQLQTVWRAGGPARAPLPPQAAAGEAAAAECAEAAREPGAVRAGAPLQLALHPGRQGGLTTRKTAENPPPSDHFKMCELFIWSECSQT